MQNVGCISLKISKPDLLNFDLTSNFAFSDTNFTFNDATFTFSDTTLSVFKKENYM